MARLGPDSEGLVPGLRITRVLGRGGMGTVYLAMTESGEECALKVLHRSTDPSRAHRFRREIEGLRKLKVPGVVQLLDHGESDGVLWFTMEWIRGPSLHTILKRRGRLEESETRRILARVARIVHSVHKQGMVHRDLKPSNILLTVEGEPILADFGLTRQVRTDTHTHLTRRPVGTPAYMAPEILKVDGVDWVRADVYGLGAVFARALLGRVPRGDWDLDDVPGELLPILERALASRPHDRYASAEAFAKAVDDPLQSDQAVERRWLIGFSAVITVVAASLAYVSLASSAGPSLEPMKPWLAQGRTAEADLVFQTELDHAARSERGALWLERASLLQTSTSLGEAWWHGEPVHRQKALQNLGLLWLEEGRYDRLEQLASLDEARRPAMTLAQQQAHQIYLRQFGAASKMANGRERALLALLNRSGVPPRPARSAVGLGRTFGIDVDGNGTEERVVLSRDEQGQLRLHHSDGTVLARASATRLSDAVLWGKRLVVLVEDEKGQRVARVFSLENNGFERVLDLPGDYLVASSADVLADGREVLFLFDVEGGLTLLLEPTSAPLRVGPEFVELGQMPNGESAFEDARRLALLGFPLVAARGYEPLWLRGGEDERRRERAVQLASWFFEGGNAERALQVLDRLGPIETWPAGTHERVLAEGFPEVFGRQRTGLGTAVVESLANQRSLLPEERSISFVEADSLETRFTSTGPWFGVQARIRAQRMAHPDEVTLRLKGDAENVEVRISKEADQTRTFWVDGVPVWTTRAAVGGSSTLVTFAFSPAQRVVRIDGREVAREARGLDAQDGWSWGAYVDRSDIVGDLDVRGWGVAGVAHIATAVPLEESPKHAGVEPR